MTLVAVYRDGRRWEIVRSELSQPPTFRSGLCSLWLMQHTVVMDAEGGDVNAWDDQSRPTRTDLARIGSLFGKEAARAVEQKLLWGPS
jgi:hypothetical protein